MKEMRKTPEGDLLAKWDAASQWLSRFEDSDDWAIVLMDGDRNPSVTIGFVLECVWRSHWVTFDEADGYQRLLAGFNEIPEPLPAFGAPKIYSRGSWVFESQPRHKRRKTLQERRGTWGEIFQPDAPATRLDLSLDVQIMDRDRASVFIGCGGSENSPPVVVYWWD